MKLLIAARVNPFRRYDLTRIPTEMKNLHRCPKCSGRRIWVIEPFSIPSDSSDKGDPLAVISHLPSAQGEAKSRFSFQKLSPVGHFDLYLCDGCGYSELWAEGFKSRLRHDPQNGIRLLDTGDATEGPFR
jgi:hypothetical protein